LKPQDFIRMVEQYYGEYDRPLIKATVLKYLQGMSAGMLQPLYKQLLLMHSNQYKAVPDVAVLEAARMEMERNDNGVYRNGQRIGYYDGGRFIPDLSLLSKEQLEQYSANYEYYEYPQEYMKLLGEKSVAEVKRGAITADAGR
jgi:hypothetical protein